MKRPEQVSATRVELDPMLALPKTTLPAQQDALLQAMQGQVISMLQHSKRSLRADCGRYLSAPAAA